MHLARRFAAKAGKDTVADVAVLRLNRSRRATRGTATRTTGGLVLETLGGVKLLLARSEHERVAAVLTSDFFVGVGQLLCNLPWVQGKTLRIVKTEML